MLYLAGTIRLSLLITPVCIITNISTAWYWSLINFWPLSFRQAHKTSCSPSFAKLSAPDFNGWHGPHLHPVIHTQIDFWEEYLDICISYIQCFCLNHQKFYFNSIYDHLYLKNFNWGLRQLTDLHLSSPTTGTVPIFTRHFKSTYPPHTYTLPLSLLPK